MVDTAVARQIPTTERVFDWSAELQVSHGLFHSPILRLG